MKIFKRCVAFRMRADYCEKLKFIAKSNNMFVTEVLIEIILKHIENYEETKGIILIDEADIKKW